MGRAKTENYRKKIKPNLKESDYVPCIFIPNQG